MAFGVIAPCSASAQAPAGPGDRPQIANGRELPVRELVLENGMRFLMLERPGAPTVSFVVHVPIGSVHDPPGRSGLSHFLEHLLFKGTTTIGTADFEAERVLLDEMDSLQASLSPNATTDEVEEVRSRLASLEDSARVFVIPNEFDRIFTRNGALGPNATTSHEATQYFVSLPSNRAELWFAMEADRMTNPVFREFYTERDVILEERRTRVDASPSGQLSIALLETAFEVHPYGRPPIGSAEDVASLSRPAVREYHRRYYGPENTTVAMVGRFDVDSAVVWAERYFSGIPRGESSPPPVEPESIQREERRREVVQDAEPQIRIAWKIPAAIDPEAPVFAMMANILVGAADARLYRRLVREDRVASSVFAGSGPGSLYPSLFTIQATPLSPHTPAEVENAIYEELERLKTEPPTQDELARVRTRLSAAEVRRLTSPEALAFQLVASQARWGDWRETFRFQERIRAVSAEDILQALERYFGPEGRTVVIVRSEEGAA